LPPRPNNFDELARTPLLFEPGTRWSYSIGIDILGHVITAVSGLAIDDYLATHVTEPLGMTDTTFTLSPAQRGRLVAVHQRRADGTLGDANISAGNGPDFLAAGGGLCGTAGDYMRFLRMLLGGGALDGVRILGIDTVSALGRNQIRDIDVVPMISTDSAISCNCDFFPNMQKKWGLAGMINTCPGSNGRSAGSVSWAGAANTYFWIDFTAGIAGVLPTQSLPFSDPKVIALLGAFERSVYGLNPLEVQGADRPH
jgi:CubicO group peptidase (beta-lactamase class C family)